MEFLSSTFHTVWPLFVAVLGAGPVVWFATEFVARPIRRFFDLRSEIKRSMLLVWDAPEYGRVEEWEEEMAPFKESREGLTKLSAEMSAFAQSERLAVFVIKMLGYDPLGAGKSAKKLAFELGTNIEDRDRNYRRVDRTLKFKFDSKRPFYNPYNAGQ